MDVCELAFPWRECVYVCVAVALNWHGSNQLDSAQHVRQTRKKTHIFEPFVTVSLSRSVWTRFDIRLFQLGFQTANGNGIIWIDLVTLNKI